MKDGNIPHESIRRFKSLMPLDATQFPLHVMDIVSESFPNDCSTIEKLVSLGDDGSNEDPFNNRGK